MTGTFGGICVCLLAAAVSLPALVSEDVLEPSVQNEVDHALSRVPTNGWERVATNVALLAEQDRLLRAAFLTNGLGKTEVAIRLVSAQRVTGRWFAGTNDVTAAAVGILKGL